MEFQDGGHGIHLVFPNGTNFENNLARMMPYHPVKFQIDWQKCHQVRVWNWNFKIAAILCFKMAPISKTTYSLGVPYHPVKFQINRQKRV